jgi:hypothetical protein
VAVLKKLNSLSSNDNNSTNINYHQNEQSPLSNHLIEYKKRPRNMKLKIFTFCQFAYEMLEDTKEVLRRHI